jgi:cytochrome c553
MVQGQRLVVSLCIAFAFPSFAFAQANRGEEAALDFFEKRVRPVLVDNCYNCHSANTNARGGLRVDDRNGLIAGGDRGPAVVPGHPEKSLLLKAVQQKADVKMPPKKKLSDEQIADLAKWIKDGAAWPKPKVPSSLGQYEERYAKLRKEHWAWQPLRIADVPSVQDPAWPRSDVDRFLLAALEAKKLRPVGDADRVTLLRRVTFDLTGLPPTPDEMNAFLTDTSPEALAKAVDRLLQSPAFGEHWGRHWLDVARYGESTGSARNLPYPHAWRYRNYVIHAFNSDKPYDQFVREQLAGDLLPAKTHEQREEQLVATGFLALGVRDVNQRFKVRFVMDNIDEQIDTVTRGFLGLTASCARCHDHKFDPIPAKDYYALAGIFHSTDLCAGLKNKMGGGGMDFYDTSLLLVLDENANIGPDPVQLKKANDALAQARAEMTRLRDDGENGKPASEQTISEARKRITKLQNDVLALTDPANYAKVALGARDAKVIADTELRIRGEAEKLGPVIPRGYLSLLNVPDAPKIRADSSGRLELAEWIVSRHNPLTPRVMVNRVWHYLFGQGLVTTVDNFGVTGDSPSHPELLDHLAARFMREGWSVKKLIRALVLTRAYGLSAEVQSAQRETDPSNRLVWRHSPRRLYAEELRDAMLAAAGTLDLKAPSASPAKDLKVMELQDNSPLARQIEDAAFRSRHRSVYLPLVRGLTPRALDVFDFAEQGMVTGSRDTTTVAPQALFLLNDPFVRNQARALAERVLRDNATEDAERIAQVYRLTLNRAAEAGEIERARAYLVTFEADFRKEVEAARKEPEATPEESILTLDPKLAAWSSFCQAMLGSAEFRYVR